jgi:hypothetical protein
MVTATYLVATVLTVAVISCTRDEDVLAPDTSAAMDVWNTQGADWIREQRQAQGKALDGTESIDCSGTDQTVHQTMTVDGGDVTITLDAYRAWLGFSQVTIAYDSTQVELDPNVPYTLRDSCAVTNFVRFTGAQVSLPVGTNKAILSQIGMYSIIEGVAPGEWVLTTLHFEPVVAGGESPVEWVTSGATPNHHADCCLRSYLLPEWDNGHSSHRLLTLGPGAVLAPPGGEDPPPDPPPAPPDSAWVMVQMDSLTNALLGPTTVSIETNAAISAAVLTFEYDSSTGCAYGAAGLPPELAGWAMFVYEDLVPPSLPGMTRTVRVLLFGGERWVTGSLDLLYPVFYGVEVPVGIDVRCSSSSFTEAGTGDLICWPEWQRGYPASVGGGGAGSGRHKEHVTP